MSAGALSAGVRWFYAGLSAASAVYCFLLVVPGASPPFAHERFDFLAFVIGLAVGVALWIRHYVVDFFDEPPLVRTAPRAFVIVFVLLNVGLLIAAIANLQQSPAESLRFAQKCAVLGFSGASWLSGLFIWGTQRLPWGRPR